MPLRKHMPPAANETEDLRVFVEYAPVAMAMLDKELRYICASRRWREPFGNPDVPVVGKSHLEMFPNLPEKWLEIYKRCLAGAVERSDRDTYTRENGQVVHIRWEIRPWYNSSCEIGGLLIFSDIIDGLVMAEERERRSELLLRNFFTYSPLSMGVLELDGDDYRFVHANRVTARHFKRENPADLVGLSPRQLGRTPEQVAFWIKQLRKAEAEGFAEFVFQLSDQMILSVHVSKTPSLDSVLPRFCVVVREITEERRAQQALAASEERLKFAMEATHEGIWDWDLQSGYLFASPQVSDQLGYSRDEVTPTFEFWNSISHPDDVAETMRLLNDHFAGKTPNFEGEYRFRHKDGRYIWFHGRAVVVKRDKDGKPLRMVGAHEDITRRKMAQEELRRAKEAAQAASEAKSAFLANVSHEIRTPLTSILGYLDLLQDKGFDAERHDEFIEIIRRNGKHLLSLINGLLDLAKIEAGKIEVEQAACRVSEIINEITTLVSPRAAAKQLQFSIDMPAAIPALVTDPMRLRQVLVNLIDNAVKFTPEGGSVNLRVVREADGRRVRFDVIDTGIGISEEQLARLFQPFMQADESMARRFGGTGLGLAISRRLARALGGDLEVFSARGRGSTFSLTLPLAPVLHEISNGKAVSADAGRLPAQARVLLVEDGVDNQILLAHILRRHGAQVDVVDDGMRAIQKVTEAQAGGRGYDVILMDVQMPGMDGNAATALLRDRNIRTPIIALSAAGMEQNRQKSLAAGCNDFLTKPVDSDELLQTLGRWITNQ